MLQNELIELANFVSKRRCETQTIEVKAAHQGCPKVRETLSSFSNQDDGGVILFGLDEAQGFRAVGIYDAQKLQKSITEQCNEMVPPVRPVFTIAEFDNVIIASAEIPPLELAERPCYYGGAGKSKGSYLRVGEADMHMTEYEIYSYEAFRKHLHDDERTVERASLSALNAELMEEYVNRRRKGRPGFGQLTLEQSHEMLGITRDGHPTLAAIMNLSVYPQGFFPQLGITAVVVPGTKVGDVAEDSSRFLDNKRIEGTINDMVLEAMQFCNRNMKSRTVIDPESGKRQDRLEYPPEAIREAILNALIHRDYSFYTEGTPVQIIFYQDRLEIHSPGNLYGRMTIEQLGHAKPDLRNPVLAIMAEALTGAENRYSGIPTMRRELAAYGLPEPKFENRRNEFIVTFYNAKKIDARQQITLEELTDMHKQLLAYCRIPRSRTEIANFVGVRTQFYVMQKYVQPLLMEGLLEMTMPERPKSSKQRYYTASKVR